MPAANRASPDLLVGNGVLDAGHAWTEAYIVATAVAQLKRCRPRLGAATVIRVWPAGAARLCRAPQGPAQLLPPAAVTTTMEGAVRGGASIAMSGGIEGAGIDWAREQGTGQPQAAGTAVPGSSRPRWVFRRLRAGPRRTTWRRWFGVAATVLSVAAGTCWAAAWAGGSDQSAALSEWSPCAAANGAAGMQCAILNVPLD